MVRSSIIIITTPPRRALYADHLIIRRSSSGVYKPSSSPWSSSSLSPHTTNRGTKRIRSHISCGCLRLSKIQPSKEWLSLPSPLKRRAKPNHAECSAIRNQLQTITCLDLLPPPSFYKTASKTYHGALRCQKLGEDRPMGDRSGRLGPARGYKVDLPV